MTTQKTTQKTILSGLRSWAADLGALVSIRKNAYGEYDTRIRMNGSREYVLSYLADSFDDACASAESVLDQIEESQRAEGVRRAREYDAQLQVALGRAAIVLGLVGCRIYRESDGDTITMYSPKTGGHSLYMKLGVRPVSDLMAHVVGFAEQQSYRYAPKA